LSLGFLDKGRHEVFPLDAKESRCECWRYAEGNDSFTPNLVDVFDFLLLMLMLRKDGSVVYVNFIGDEMECLLFIMGPFDGRPLTPFAHLHVETMKEISSGTAPDLEVRGGISFALFGFSGSLPCENVASLGGETHELHPFGAGECDRRRF